MEVGLSWGMITLHLGGRRVTKVEIGDSNEGESDNRKRAIKEKSHREDFL